MTVTQLGDLGVRRISVGGALARTALGAFLEAAKQIAEEGRFTRMASGVPFATLNDAFRKFFSRYDLLLTPTLAAPPLPVGVDDYRQIGGRAVGSRGWIAFTFPLNLTGMPAATVPCGWTPEGLPIGLQIIGPRLAESLVLRASAAFEALVPWAGKRPPLD